MMPVGVLKISRGTLYKVYDCLTTKLYTRNQYKIIFKKTLRDGISLSCLLYTL